MYFLETSFEEIWGQSVEHTINMRCKHKYFVKSWCEWKEIATGWQQNTQQKEETGAPFNDQIREFEGEAGGYFQLVHRECSLAS